MDFGSIEKVWIFKIMKLNNKQSSSRKFIITTYLVLILIYLSTLLIFPFAQRFVNYVLSNDKAESHISSFNNLSTKKNTLQHRSLCKPLDTNSSYNKSNSPSRDAILLFATRYNAGLDLALKSLKATQSRAQVILFTNEREFYANDDAKKFMNSMNIKIITDCKEDPNVTRVRGTNSAVPHMLRFKCERDWIKENINNIDRVLHSDAYDIFFQNDPFQPYEDHDLIGYDKLTFVVEPHFIRGCGWNLAWFTHCYGPETTRKFEDNFIICSGTIAGSASDYLKLVEMMISQEEWKTCYSPSHDQPILNYLLWSKKIEEAGIKYTLAGCDGGFATLQWCTLNMKVDYDEYGQVVLPSKVVPSYIHQYPRIPGLSDHLFEACGIKKY